MTLLNALDTRLQNGSAAASFVNCLVRLRLSALLRKVHEHHQVVDPQMVQDILAIGPEVLMGLDRRVIEVLDAVAEEVLPDTTPVGPVQL